MTLRWRLTGLTSLLLAALLSLGLWGLQHWATAQSYRRGQEILQAAGNRIRLGVADKLSLHELIQEEIKISKQPLSIALYDGNSLVELIGHEPPSDGDNWELLTLEAHNRRVVLGFPIYQAKDALRRQAHFLAWIGGLVWAALSLTTYWVVGQTLKPIETLARQLEQAADKPGPAQIAAPSQDGELTHLTATINKLLGQLHQRSARREQFHVAVSHELRTPLQALLGHLELALLRPRPVEEYQTALQECKNQTVRLTQLIEALLLLNRLDYAPMEADTIDLNECFPEGSLPPDTEIRFADQEVSVQASQPLLEVLLRNLLNNAHLHRQPGTPIQVEIGPQQLRIQNLRPSQQALDLEKLREPFYRGGGQVPGNGLGLALASAVVERLGWQLHLEAPPGQFIATAVYQAGGP
ncbi:MAG: HAMP domain-containing histidine kinase [Candidatus Eremiobacteraeota bacterium]|nr:HAMP domain-containing histidine kinase [Candidatus Eremiobacteraeota bacterium]